MLIILMLCTVKMLKIGTPKIVNVTVPKWKSLVLQYVNP